jgi:uncharacterized membrane protein
VHEDDVDDGGDTDVGERRAPVVVAGLVAVALPFLMPGSFRNPEGRVLAIVQLVLLVAMLVADPGRIDRRSRGVHLVRLALIVVMAMAAAASAIELVIMILERDQGTSSANELLWAGGLVWLHLVLAFAFLYWEMDAGGPGERAHRPPAPGDLLFPQQADRTLGEDWRPVFFDYLHVAATGAISFSPADVVALTHRAKAVTVVESATSLAILGLVVARAVNILA